MSPEPKANANDDPEPQELLPEVLRQEWVALPKLLLYQVFLVGFLLGTGAALFVYGLIVGDSVAMNALPIALGIGLLQNKLVPWDRHAMARLRAWRG